MIIDDFKEELKIEFLNYVDEIFNIKEVDKISIFTKSIRKKMLNFGAKMLENWYKNNIGTGYQGTKLTIIKNNKEKELTFIDNLSKTYTTCLGDISIKRAYYFKKENSYIPLEEKHSYLKDSFFPEIKEMSCLVSCIDPYGIASDLLNRIGAIKVSATSIKKITKEIGGDLAKNEDEKAKDILNNISNIERSNKVEDILVVSADGAHVKIDKEWKEVKSGAVYGITKDTSSNEIKAVNKTYISRVENCHNFGNRIYLEALKRNVDKSSLVITIGDGARWIWDQFDLHFPNSVQIIDWYHATEHLYKITSLIYKDDDKEKKDFEKVLKDNLYEGNIHNLKRLVFEKTVNKKIKDGSNKYKQIEVEINYFMKNIEKMQYKDFEDKGYPIGSGVIEGACKNLVQIRMKRNGMRWSNDGAHAVLQLRCLYLSDRWNEVEEYAEQKSA
jgi:hypothetical protein